MLEGAHRSLGSHLDATEFTLSSHHRKPTSRHCVRVRHVSLAYSRRVEAPSAPASAYLQHHQVLTSGGAAHLALPVSGDRNYLPNESGEAPFCLTVAI